VCVRVVVSAASNALPSLVDTVWYVNILFRKLAEKYLKFLLLFFIYRLTFVYYSRY